MYNNTHPYLPEHDENARGGWLGGLDKIEALHTKAVVAAHGVPDPDNSPRHYLYDFNATLPTCIGGPGPLQDGLALDPDRVNPGPPWATAKAPKP